MIISDECLLAECPHCGNNKELISLLSGNTFGSQLWSDTKTVSPMLMEPSPIQMCLKCGGYFFLSKVNTSYKDGGTFETGNLSFYDAIFAKDEFDDLSVDEDKLLSLIIIWAYNDIYRSNLKPSKTQYNMFKSFVIDLLYMPYFNDNLLLKAELNREIEQFNECKDILSNYCAENEFLERIKAEIMEKAENKIKEVFIIE